MPFVTSGEKRHAKTDVCILDCSQNDILLLVQEDKKPFPRNPFSAQARLVAEAVAAFDRNNKRRMAAGLPPLAEKVSYLTILSMPRRDCSF
jgi:hypothetical protein